MTKEKINFVSKIKRYQIWVNDKKLAQFEDMGGGYGAFSTDDEELVKQLKSLPDYNKIFHSLEGAKFPKFLSLRTLVGAQISSSKEPDVDKIKANAKAEAELEAAKKVAEERTKLSELKKKILRYGELEGKWKKKDGEFRADAPQEDIEEYNQLKNEIGE